MHLKSLKAASVLSRMKARCAAEVKTNVQLYRILKERSGPFAPCKRNIIALRLLQEGNIIWKGKSHLLSRVVNSIKQLFLTKISACSVILAKHLPNPSQKLRWILKLLMCGLKVLCIIDANPGCFWLHSTTGYTQNTCICISDTCTSIVTNKLDASREQNHHHGHKTIHNDRCLAHWEGPLLWSLLSKHFRGQKNAKNTHEKHLFFSDFHESNFFRRILSIWTRLSNLGTASFLE